MHKINKNEGEFKMSKVIAILLIIFIVYTFLSVSSNAKAEITKSTIDIPFKITNTINNIVETTTENVNAN
jgi:hypothetical protein